MNYREAIELAIINAGLCPHGRGSIQPWRCNMCAEVHDRPIPPGWREAVKAATTTSPWADPNHDIMADFRRYAQPPN